MEISDPGSQPVPHMVSFTADNMRRAAEAGAGFEVRVGTSGAHWVLGIDLPGGDGLRIVFTRYRRVWDLDRGQSVQVIVGGEDRSAQAGGDVEAAMALLAGGSASPPADSPPGRSAVGRRESSRPTTGVATRRMVVIRE